MATADSDDRQRLDRWLSLIRGPALIGPADMVFPRRAQAIAEMQAAGAERLFPLLKPMLSDPDPPVRLAACEALFFVDGRRASELALPLLADPESEIRWFVCGCLPYSRDEQAIGPLLRVLKEDSSAQVRGAAACSLGRIGSPATIPALLAALETDHEPDMHGHSASSQAASAIDNILGTNETRIRLPNGMCTMRRGEPDLDLLRRLAVERFEQWTRSRAEPGATADGRRM
jgi:HEAT repeat protein